VIPATLLLSAAEHDKPGTPSAARISPCPTTPIKAGLISRAPMGVKNTVRNKEKTT
jgi:hypothetical protein